MALMVGAMIIQGITPGPQVMSERPELVWGMIASMWIGNLLLVILNLPLIADLDPAAQSALSLAVSCHPVVMLHRHLQLEQQRNEVGMAVLFGLLGYLFIKLGCEPAPLLLAMVLGPMMEDELRRGMTINRGDANGLSAQPV